MLVLGRRRGWKLGLSKLLTRSDLERILSKRKERRREDLYQNKQENLIPK